MAYNITYSGGVITVNDGVINDSATDIQLVGRNAANYGEPIAQNFVSLLENFANSTQPTTPVPGQIWYDTTDDGSGNHIGLKVYDGTTWTPLATGDANSIGAGGTAGTSDSDRLASVWAQVGNFNDLTVNNNLTLGAGVEVGTHAVPITGVHAETIHASDASGTGGLLIGPARVTPVNEAAAAAGTYLGPVDADSVAATSLTANTIGVKSATNITLSNSLVLGSGGINIGDATTRLGTLFAQNINTNGTINLNNGTLSGVSAGGIETITTRVITTGAAATTGTITGDWTLTAGSKLESTFADIAERFAADKEYDYGTVVKIAGDNEITETTEDGDIDAFGIIAHKPAFILNQAVGNDLTHPPVALAGRTPVKLIGTAKKGDRIVASDVPGVAKAVSKLELSTISPFAVIGRALEDKEGSEQGLLMVAIGAK